MNPPPRQDLAHLQLAAYALAYPVLSGAMDFNEAASCLALAGVAAGLLEDKSDQQFEMVRDRLERSLVHATVAIEDKAAERIRQAIKPAIERRYPRQVILDIARLENLLAPFGLGGTVGSRAARLPDATVEEICRAVVRTALGAEDQERATNG